LTLCDAPLPVLRRADLSSDALTRVVAPYGARLVELPPGAQLPCSYWGAPEAGLAGNRLFVRDDTPVHSLLHELGHYVCMTPVRRASLWLDAGGDDDEECAVCYLQLVLADHVAGFGRACCCDDMDVWGYSFREGSTRAWRDGDGADARRWLVDRGLIDVMNRPTWRLRSL
jgi:hypothetical protein